MFFKSSQKKFNFWQLIDSLKARFEVIFGVFKFEFACVRSQLGAERVGAAAFGGGGRGRRAQVTRAREQQHVVN